MVINPQCKREDPVRQDWVFSNSEPKHSGFAKVEIAVARGRKNDDKRQAIAEKESKCEAERATGRRSKGY